MLTDFQIFFTGRLSSKFLEKVLIEYPPYLKHVAALPCEMFVLKNRNNPKPSKANIHARLCHFKQLLRNIHPMVLASFLFSDDKIFTVTTPKNPYNDLLYAYPSSEKKDVVTRRLRT